MAEPAWPGHNGCCLVAEISAKESPMAKQKRQASNRPAQRAKLANWKARQRAPERENQRDEENKRRFVDQSGVVAQDLPDARHGQNVMPDAHEMKRNLPHQHGGEVASDRHAEGGIRGDRGMSDSDDHGGRKHN
jgi:hypothetical protein